MQTEGVPRMSATIYQFPAGGRASLAGATHPSPDRKPSVAVATSPVITACGAAWYHEEAMREDERARSDH
jgi:hypothetical protein